MRPIVELEEKYPILVYFRYAHLPQFLQDVSAPFCCLARKVADELPRNFEETSSALRKLLEAKDCAVRAALPPPGKASTLDQTER